ncbi:hypothetical protein [Sebaldella sp. S0638]|uniref:hypothetical protein n=1 Tax=Sebaldella sp. S0638 TaxID=2957809 RepID=UPI00209CEF1C|nr:hypothetical protein [Sebaldella sp. S0638]MCP1226463.1 hypothetical protein [Sebaldella sp. S0638]
MEQKLIDMIKEDRELEYMLWEILYAKENGVNCDANFQIRNREVRKRKISVTSLIKSCKRHSKN